ncbi:MAG: peptidoglycan editing factor PgeF, partial [Holosporales bacterium]|nr:peptidoglycan editing factor PgeF [Holosporales bacterium]
NFKFIKHGFFGRNGGYSSGIFESLNVGVDKGDDPHNVLKNREKVANYFGVTAQELVIPKQVHGNIAQVIDCVNEVECDALITNTQNLLIGINTADCCPVLLCSPLKKYISAIHCGWRGALAGIIENTMKELQSLGCYDIVGAIGPCIQQKSYEIGDEIMNKVHSKYIRNRHFDLPLYVYDKLLECGAKDISKIDVDTFTNKAYFSYRRQAAGNGAVKCGVQFSGITIVGE